MDKQIYQDYLESMMAEYLQRGYGEFALWIVDKHIETFSRNDEKLGILQIEIQAFWENGIKDGGIRLVSDITSSAVKKRWWQIAHKSLAGYTAVIKQDGSVTRG